MEFSFNTRRILSYTRRAVDDYSMIENGDKIAVGLSGGKDSVALVCALANLKKFYPKEFELEVISMDPGFYKAGFGDEKEVKETAPAWSLTCFFLATSIGEQTGII